MKSPIANLFLLVGGILFSFAGSSAASPDLSLYGWETRVVLLSIGDPQTISLPLTTKILNQVNDAISNVQLINRRNEEIPFDLYLQKAHKYKNLNIREVSHDHDTLSPNNLVDNDGISFYQFVTSDDKASVIIDLERPTVINRITIYPYHGRHISHVTISGSVNGEDFTTLTSKSGLRLNYDFTKHMPYRFFRLEFTGHNVSLADIHFFASRTAAISFEALPGESYKLLHGNTELHSIRYQKKLTEPPQTDLIAKLGTTKWNTLASADMDDDRVNNETDNCPFIANKKQHDIDEDGIGDICDNAPNNKNYDQVDTDTDGVGDIVDNCKLAANPLQLDQDKDGEGNECDQIDNRQTNSEPVNNDHYWLLVMVTVLVVVLCFLWYRAHQIPPSKPK